MAMEVRPVKSIKVGGRIRQDLGDMDALVASIDANGGLLQPILIGTDNRLIAGYRRLAAYKRLGRDMIEVHVRNDLDSAVSAHIAERDENTCREPFTPEEAVLAGRRLEELERPAAKARQATHGAAPGRPATNSVGEKPTVSERGIRPKVAAAVGMSGTTYDKAKKVVEAAEAGDPEAAEALKEMNATGKVEPAYRKVKKKPPKYTPKPFDTSTPRNQLVANKAMERVNRATGTLSGTARGLAELKIEHVIANATPDDFIGWETSLKQVVSQINEFRNRLKEASK